jgi:integrase
MRKVDTTVKDLVGMIERGELKLPEMQRRYVWRAPRVRDLFDSLYRGYRSGSVLVWETDQAQPTRDLAVPQLASPFSGHKLLLDGQQRLTSLSAVLSGRPVKVRGRQKPIDILFNLEHPDGAMEFTEVAENEKVPATIYHGLTAVSGLKAGRSDAREPEPVRPVADEMVGATILHLSPTVRAMVQLQRLSGARPGEICTMKVGEVDRTGPVWIYRPSSHKTAHHGHQRIIHIGPKAQVVLSPFLMKIDADAYVFTPIQAEAERRTALHENRKTPVNYGNRPGTNCKRKPKRPPGDHYDVAAYRRAIERAAAAAFPPPKHLACQRIEGKKGMRNESRLEWRQRLGAEKWKELQAWRHEHSWHPHQLRHSAATEIRRRFGIEAAHAPP